MHRQRQSQARASPFSKSKICWHTMITYSLLPTLDIYPKLEKSHYCKESHNLNSLWNPSSHAPAQIKKSKNSKTFQNILKFFGDEHIQIFYKHDKFRGEITISLHCAKKAKSVAKMRFKTYLFRALIFFHRS